MHGKHFFLALALGASGAFAQATSQPAAPQTPGGLEEIVVTAQRREQDLQEVPISVTAIQSGDLEDLQIQNFSEIGYAIPNLSTNIQIGAATTPAFSIRGVTSGLLTFSVDSGVGLYLDGVYVARSAGSAFDLADVERVEVLRGPQGILWGKNTTAGAINFVTAKPAESFGVRQTLSFGNFDLFKSRTTLNTGEWNGFSARLTYAHGQQDGYIDNLAAGRTIDFRHGFGARTSVKELGAENNEGILLAVHYENGGLRGDYKFDWTDLVATQQGTQAIGFTNNPDPVFQGFLGAVIALQPSVGGIGIVDAKRRSELANDMMTPDHLEVQGHSIALEYDLTEAITLRSITGYRRLHEITGGNDIDGNALRDPGFFGAPGEPFTFISSIQDREQDQISEELQLLGETGAIDWLGGFYYFKEEGDDKNPVWLFADFVGDAAPTGLFPPPISNHADVENDSKALFAHATWHILENLHLSGGVRQTWDERKMHDRVVAGREGSGKFDNFDWSVGLALDMAEELNVYATVTTGYLSGGFLNGEPFDEEEVTAYELGAKSRWWDGRITFNLAGFYEDYKDLQVPVFTTQLELFNAGKANIKGVELETALQPVEGLRLSLGWGFQDFEYEELRLGAGNPDISDTARRTNTPENTLNMGMQYDFPELSFGRLSARIDGSWRDDVFFLLQEHFDAATDEAATQEAHWLLGARLSLGEIPIGRWMGNDRITAALSVWGQNLLDEDEPQFASDLGSLIVGKFMKPRTYGVDVAIEF